MKMCRHRTDVSYSGTDMGVGRNTSSKCGHENVRACVFFSEYAWFVRRIKKNLF